MTFILAEINSMKDHGWLNAFLLVEINSCVVNKRMLLCNLESFDNNNNDLESQTYNVKKPNL